MDELKVTEKIILLTLKKRNISKSPGLDEIGAILLMELSENICHPLRKIFETSIKTSSIPEGNGRMPKYQQYINRKQEISLQLPSNKPNKRSL